jgi:hypothetical protein
MFGDLLDLPTGGQKLALFGPNWTIGPIQKQGTREIEFLERATGTVTGCPGERNMTTSGIRCRWSENVFPIMIASTTPGLPEGT